MATLPAASRDPLSGPTQSLDTVTPTDFGLRNLAQGVDAFEASGDRLAQAQAKHALDGADAAYAGTYSQMATAYTPANAQPGFAQKALDVYDTQLARARQGLQGDQAQAWFNSLSAQRRTSYGQQAAQHEGTVLGQIQAEGAAAAQTARVAVTAQTFRNGQDDMTRTDAANGDVMARPDYIDGRVARFDAAAKSALDGASEADRPALSSELTNQKVNLMASLHATVVGANEAQINRTVGDGLQQLENDTAGNPARMNDNLLAAQKLVVSLPYSQRQAVLDKLPGDFLGAVGRQIQASNNYGGMAAFLATPDVRAHLSSGDFAALSGWVTSQGARQAMAVAQDTANRGLDNELSTIMTTGKSSGFDPQSFVKAFPDDGAVRATAAQRQVAQAQNAFSIVTQAPTLSPGEFDQRVLALKPAAGDPDFADKQAMYDKAVAAGRQMQQARMNDPAGADVRNPDGAIQAQWAQVAQGTPGAPINWAQATLARQAHWGVPDTSQRILPLAVAQQQVSALAKAPPQDRDAAMGSIYHELQGYGAYGGQVLKELQTSGLEGRDAAVLHMAGDNPIALGQYSRAVEVMKGAPKPTKEVAAQIQSAVDSAWAPFAKAYGFSSKASIFADNARRAVEVMTQSGVHDGKSADQAAKAAVVTLTNGAAVDDKLGYVLPAAVAGQQVKQNFNAMPKPSLFNMKPGPFDAMHIAGSVDGKAAVRNGVNAVLRDYVTHPETLGAPGFESTMTDQQKRQRYADTIGDKAIPVTTDDGQGVQFMLPDGKGSVVSIKDAKGQPITRTWAQLIGRVTGGQ